MARRFVLGDIHGEYDYLVDVLKKVNFDYKNDILIQIGDIVDRGPEPFKCMDELLKIKHLILLKGNHDDTFRTYIKGGRNMLAAFPSNGVNATEIKWKELTAVQRIYYTDYIFDRMLPYYVTDDNILFVHGGFDPSEPIDKQEESYLIWDRDLVNAAYAESLITQVRFPLTKYKKVFIGHTPTLYYGLLVPFTGGGVTNIDTGSGKGGPLTIMDIDTGEFWQSDYSEQIKEYVILKTKDKSSDSEKEEERASEGEIALAA